MFSLRSRATIIQEAIIAVPPENGAQLNAAETLLPCAIEDPGPIDLTDVFDDARKEPAAGIIRVLIRN